MANNVTLARSLYEAWNERDFDRLADLTAPDGQITIVSTGDSFHGPEGAREYHTMWADGFPNGSIRVDRVIASDECVVVEFTGRGTHTGTLRTPTGSIPATGRSVTLQLCDVLDYSAGKILWQRTYFDSGSLMAQLGVPAEETAEETATTQK